MLLHQSENVMMESIWEMYRCCLNLVANILLIYQTGSINLYQPYFNYSVRAQTHSLYISTTPHPHPPTPPHRPPVTLKLAQVCSANTAKSAAVNRHNTAVSAGGASRRVARHVFQEDLLNCTWNKKEGKQLSVIIGQKPLTWLHCTYVVILVRAAFEKAAQCGAHFMARGANLQRCK